MLDVQVHVLRKVYKVQVEEINLEASKMPHSSLVSVPSNNDNEADEVDGTSNCQHPVILVDAAPVQVLYNLSGASSAT